MRGDGSTAVGESSCASSDISSTRRYCRQRKRLVLGPLGLGNARRWFAVRKAQGPKLALGAAASVRLAGFWLALACGRSRSCPLMVARADARSVGHGRTTRTTHSTSFVDVHRRPSLPPQKRRVPRGDAKKSKKNVENRGLWLRVRARTHDLSHAKRSLCLITSVLVARPELIPEHPGDGSRNQLNTQMSWRRDVFFPF